MTREQVYEQQLRELGIYEEAFRPEIATLAQLERELSRAKKAWSATVPKGEKPSLLDPLYAVIVGIRREILAHREALGLTPKALRKLRGAPPAGPTEQDLITERLSLIAERVSSYDAAPALPAGRWDNWIPQVEDAQADAASLVREWRELGAELGVDDGGGA